MIKNDVTKKLSASKSIEEAEVRPKLNIFWCSGNWETALHMVWVSIKLPQEI